MLARKTFSSDNTLGSPEPPRVAEVRSWLEDFKEVTKASVR